MGHHSVILIMDVFSWKEMFKKTLVLNFKKKSFYVLLSFKLDILVQSLGKTFFLDLFKHTVV